MAPWGRIWSNKRSCSFPTAARSRARARRRGGATPGALSAAPDPELCAVGRESAHLLHALAQRIHLRGLGGGGRGVAALGARFAIA